MRVIGINCSPRKGETTYYALQECLRAAKEAWANIDTEILELGGLEFSGCSACGQCKKGPVCSFDDDLNDVIREISKADVKGIIIGSPVYLGTMTSQCKSLIDRSVLLRRNGWLLKDKVGGVLAVGGVRNGGQELTIQAVQAGLLCHDMMIVSDGAGTAHFGGALYSGMAGGIEADEDGLATARNLGRRVASVAVSLVDKGEAGK